MKKSFIFAATLVMIMTAIFSNVTFATSNPGKPCIVQCIDNPTPIPVPVKSVNISSDDYYQLLLMKEKRAQEKYQADTAYKAKVEKALYYYDHHECEDTPAVVIIFCIIGVIVTIIAAIIGIVAIVEM